MEQPQNNALLVAGGATLTFIIDAETGALYAIKFPS